MFDRTSLNCHNGLKNFKISLSDMNKKIYYEKRLLKNLWDVLQFNSCLFCFWSMSCVWHWSKENRFWKKLTCIICQSKFAYSVSVACRVWHWSIKKKIGMHNVSIKIWNTWQICQSCCLKHRFQFVGTGIFAYCSN